MEKRGLSLAEIQEVPNNSLILLTGPPGAGKTTFCHQVVLNGIAAERPIIFVTTEQNSSRIIDLLREKGIGKPAPGALNFVDAFTQTVGLAAPEQADTIDANCEDLNSISMAIGKLQQRIGRRNIILAFDSLTSPYLFNEKEVFRFMRLCLAKFAAEGNSVLALVDEGCGKSEHLVAMMSVADGVLKMEVKEGKRMLDVVKHPKVEPTRIEVSTDKIWKKKIYDLKTYDQDMLRHFMKAVQGETSLRREYGQFAVNLFWPNFARWSAMLWDPKGFPEMIYELWVEFGSYIREMIPLFPWHARLVFKLFVPKNFSRVKDMEKPLKFINQSWMKQRRYSIMEYLKDVSKTDEHYIRVYENRECCGFENIGATMALDLPPIIAGVCKGLEKEKRDWNIVETKCLGLGDRYCEFKLVPGEIDELKGSLKKETSVIEKIHDRLMDRLMGFLLEGKPLVTRPRLGSDFSMFLEMALSAMASERYRTALRMGGAKSGKKVGEHLIEAGIREDKAIKRVFHLLEHCKVGKVRMDETIRIRESCESLWTKFITTKLEEPSCFFITGFLNGLFLAVRKQHIKEVKCVAMGDPYCEWEIK